MKWLEKFAEEQNKKMIKSASLNKKSASRIIVDKEDIEDQDAIDGDTITYQDKKYKIINSSFVDEVGPGVVLEEILEKQADLECPTDETMNMEMGTCDCDGTASSSCAVEPEKAVQPDQGAIYDLNVDEQEIQKFNAEAVETEKQIASENAVDGTTPEGKVNRILNRIVQDIQSIQEVLPIEEVPADEPVVEEPVVEEAEEPITEDEPTVDEELTAFIRDNRILKKISQMYK